MIMSSSLENKSNGVGGGDLQIGDSAPDFELLDTNQELHKLSSSKDNKTILAFFLQLDPQSVQAKCVTLETL